jgi:hypothetical protein
LILRIIYCQDNKVLLEVSRQKKKSMQIAAWQGAGQAPAGVMCKGTWSAILEMWYQAEGD